MQWFSFNLQDFSVSFLSILFEGAPFMFIGTLIAGFVDAFVPPQMMERMLPRNASVAIGLSALLGVIFPMCECGLVPVIRRMISKGMPVSCALTYLLSAPIVNPIVAVSTLAAFRGQRPVVTASLRLGIGFLVACIAGLIVARLSSKSILNGDMQALSPNPRLHSLSGSFGSAGVSNSPSEQLAFRGLPAKSARRHSLRRPRFPGRRILPDYRGGYREHFQYGH